MTADSLHSAVSARCTAQELSPLDWMACRYVWGELSVDEAAAFEERLAADLAVCEALGRAAQLQSAVQIQLAAECGLSEAARSLATSATMPSSPANRLSKGARPAASLLTAVSRQRVSGWVSVVAAASVLALIAACATQWQAGGQRTATWTSPPHTVAATSGESAASEDTWSAEQTLLDMWVSLRVETPDEQDGLAGGVLDLPADADDPAVAESPVEEAVVPDWMFAAIDSESASDHEPSLEESL